MSELILPKTYKDRNGKYPQHEGKPKISYSQITSWKDTQYRPDYIKQYFVGIDIPSGIYAEFGSSVGTFIESIGTESEECHKEYAHLLSDNDREHLKAIDYFDNSVYEDFILIDMGSFVIEGFADRIIYLPEKKLIVEDFKTCSIAKKKSFYCSDDYMQTNVYAYHKENEGYTIEDCRVVLLDRAGNNSPKSPLRLTGKSEIVPTPYSREKTEKFLNDVEKTAKEISDTYKTYLKIFG